MDVICSSPRLAIDAYITEAGIGISNDIDELDQRTINEEDENLRLSRIRTGVQIVGDSSSTFDIGVKQTYLKLI